MISALVAGGVKDPPAMQEMQELRDRSLGREDPLEEEMATYSSILAWRIPMDRGAWQATDHGVAKSQTWLKHLSSSSNPAEKLWNVYCISELASKCNKQLFILLSSLAGAAPTWATFLDTSGFLYSSPKSYKDQPLKEKHIGTLLVGPLVKTLDFHYRRHGFHPWLGN